MNQPQDKQQIQLAPGSMQPLEYVSTRHDAVIAAGVTPQDLLDPAFWAHHAVKLKPMDEIRARAEDGTWVGYYIVTDCSRTWARVRELSMHRLTTADVAATQASEAEVQAFMAAHKVSHTQETKWRVVRSSDRVAVQEQLGTREAALEWLERHARSQVGAPAAPKPAAVAA